MTAAFTVALTLLGAAALALLALGGYAVTLLVLSWFVRQAPNEGGEGPAPRVAALVVAHDEERVVHESVTSLGAQDGAPDGFAVFCVADRCSDGTADVARKGGATVFERRGGKDGKAAAVAFGVEAILALGRFDVIAVFDADNRVAKDFALRVAARFQRGERVVQGLVDATNPGASWVAASSALGFWALAEVNQAPRERLSLSAPLMGTGFALRAEDARALLGDATGLTDDLELGARLATRGIRVAYEPLARTLDEKPVTFAIAASQRHRWMQGRWAVAGRALPRLLRLAVGWGGASGARLRALDMAVQLVAPSLLFTAVALAAISTTTLAVARCAPEGAGSPLAPSPAFSLGAAALFYALPALGIRRFRPSAFVWLCYVVQPAYLLWSVPLAVSGWLTRHRGAWKRTPKGDGGGPGDLV